MAYSEALDQRISDYMAPWAGQRRKMFGGTCHLLNGNMMCGVYKDSLILRLGEAAAAEGLNQLHVSEFDITGRPMKGWVMVAPASYAGAALEEWLDKARAFVETLPPK